MLRVVVTWVVAIAGLMTLYAVPTTHIRSAGVISAGAMLVAVAVLGLSPRSSGGVRTTLAYPQGFRAVAVILLFVAIFGFGISSFVAIGTRPYGLEDWVAFGLLSALPLMLIRIDQEELLKFIGMACVLFAVLDVAANFLSIFGIISLNTSGRVTADGLRTRYPGLSGSTLAAGLVASTAILFLADSFSKVKSIRAGILIASVAAILIVNLYFVDARRYLSTALVGGALLTTPLGRRVPLWVPTILLPAIMVPLTFISNDGGNHLRATLLRYGWERAQDYPWIGQGLFYRSSALLMPGLDNLRGAEVTESGILDLWIAFGGLSTLIFVAAALVAVIASRAQARWESMLFALLAGSLPYNTLFGGLLSSLLFFSSFFFVVFQKRETFTRRGAVALDRPPFGVVARPPPSY